MPPSPVVTHAHEEYAPPRNLWDDIKSCAPCIFVIKKTWMAVLIGLIIFAYYITIVAITNRTSLSACQLYASQARFAPAMYIHGQWWRLITGLFLHQNPWHFVVNFYGALYTVGVMELYWGHFWVLVVFLASGMLCGATSSIVNPYMVGCGTSGPIIMLLSAHMFIVVFVPDEHHVGLSPIKIRIFRWVSDALGILTIAIVDIVGTQGTDIVFHWTNAAFGVLAGILLAHKIEMPDHILLYLTYMQMVCSTCLIVWIVIVLATLMYSTKSDQFLDIDPCNMT